MASDTARVLFLGLDGGTRSVLEAASDRGWMPNLAAFWRRSARGTLRSSAPMITPVAWTSFLTGCTPRTHGIHEFFHVEPSDRTIRPNHAGTIRVPTLWHVLDAHDRAVVSINLPMTYPPPRVRGLVVAGSDAPGRDWVFTQCPDFGREIAEHLPDFTHKILWKRRPRRYDELRTLAARNRALFRAQAEAALRADARCDWSVLLVHFHNLDSLQHRLWPYLDLDDTGLRVAGWNEEVVSCLRALDDAVGILLELASKRDAAVVAVSDHGFGPCRALVSVNGLLRQVGLQQGLPYGTRFRYRAYRLADRLRRWQARRHPDGIVRRQPRSIEGQVGCDWKRTVAFAPFGQLSGSIFLNPAVATTEAAAERARSEVIAACRAARDPVTGALLFADVLDTADHYGLDPVAEGLPDVLALSADGFQAQAKWSAFRRSWIGPDANLPGTHYLEGIIALDAPDLVPGDHLQAELHDVAPTALALLGLPVPEYMEGRVLHEAFETPLPCAEGPGVDFKTAAEEDALLAAGRFVVPEF